MWYNKNISSEVLSTLEDRVLSISNVIVALKDEGFIPNKNKTAILTFSTMLIDAFQNIDIYSEEQQSNLENLFNKILRM